MNNYEIKEKIVREGKSRIFSNWSKTAGITMEAFLDGLRWLCEDPMPEGRMTRELGCKVKDGLHRLARRYYEDGSFAGFYDSESGRIWSGNVSISCKDRI